MITNLPKINGKYHFNKPLSKYNWFKTGGTADILFEPKDKNDLIHFLKNKPKNIPIFILGGGSNLLIRDGGIRGIVILLKNNFTKISLDQNKNINVECGLLNSKFFAFCKKNLIGGYEFLGTIPGTIGGSIRMNAGCYNNEIKDKLISIETIDLDGNTKIYLNQECNFEYRKNNLPENLIFVSAIFNGNQTNTKEEIEKSFQEKTTKRKNSQPIGKKTGGCTFKNPETTPAWKLIKEVGMQNKEINGAKMSEKHANFMINTGKATSTDLENLGELIRKKVKKNTGIDLEWEIKIVGEKK